MGRWVGVSAAPGGRLPPPQCQGRQGVSLATTAAAAAGSAVSLALAPHPARREQRAVSSVHGVSCTDRPSDGGGHSPVRCTLGSSPPGLAPSAVGPRARGAPAAAAATRSRPETVSQWQRYALEGQWCAVVAPTEGTVCCAACCAVFVSGSTR